MADARRLIPTTPTAPYSSRETCHYGNCHEKCFGGLPVCFLCAISIGNFMREVFEAERCKARQDEDIDLSMDDYMALQFYSDAHDAHHARQPPRADQSVVYYLMLSPVTVKIGVTTNLRRLDNRLRTEAQYVVAIEPGDRTIEHMRHKQFAEERRDRRREDFHLSDALKAHIDALAPQRAEILSKALGLPAEQFA